jgi:hypothetical protein
VIGVGWVQHLLLAELKFATYDRFQPTHVGLAAKATSSKTGIPHKLVGKGRSGLKIL